MNYGKTDCQKEFKTLLQKIHEDNASLSEDIRLNTYGGIFGLQAGIKSQYGALAGSAVGTAKRTGRFIKGVSQAITGMGLGVLSIAETVDASMRMGQIHAHQARADRYLGPGHAANSALAVQSASMAARNAETSRSLTGYAFNSAAINLVRSTKNIGKSSVIRGIMKDFEANGKHIPQNKLPGFYVFPSIQDLIDRCTH